MPWWEYEAYEEGLAWEQPWLPRVEMVEVKDREIPDHRPPPEASADAFEAMGLTVQRMG